MKIESVRKSEYYKIFEKCVTMEDMYDAIEEIDMTNKQKGDLWEIISYFIIKLSPLLNADMTNIWLFDDIPSKLIKSLNIPAKDKGIDLVVQIGTNYFAVQSKFRQNKDSVIKWQELSTFYGLSFGVANKIQGGFFMTNTLNMCEEVNKSKKVRVIDGNFFSQNLPENFFKNICKLLREKSVIKPTKRVPLKHQVECIDLCVKHYKDNNLGHVESACGTGKTYIAQQVDKSLKNLLSVMFEPSLSVLSQTYVEFANQSHAENSKVNFLLIGSDIDTDGDMEFKGGDLNLHTDPVKIREVIDASIKKKTKLIVICTYQSSDKLAEACKKNTTKKLKEIKFDFGIFDEAHKTVGQVGKQFTLMLEDTNLVIKKRLFMTATPKMYQGALNDDNESDVISMDNEKYYGKKIFCYGVGTAIKDKVLTNYDIISLVVTDDEMEKLIKKHKLVKFKKEFSDVESNYLGIILLLLKKMHDGTINHLLTYHNTVARAKKFYEFMEKINGIMKGKPICANSFDGSTSMSKRNKLIAEFTKSGNGVLCTARVLNEGVNIPIIDSVCFVDERNSTIDIVQCVGRMLRKYQGKDMAHVFIPTFIKSLDDDELNGSTFGNTVRIIKAMKTTDEEIVEYFMKDTGEVNGKVKFELVTADLKKPTAKAVKEKFSQEIKFTEWVKSVEGKVWEIVDTFMNTYKRAKAWIDENKKIPAQSSKDLTEKQLANWCTLQRLYKRTNKLDTYKIKQLEKFDEWYWNKNDVDEKILEIKEWMSDNNKIPSGSSKNLIERQLGKWCNVQRANFRNNKLSSADITKLQKLNGWFWDKSEFLDKRIDEFKKWVLKNKTTPCDHSKNPVEKSLSKWASKRRQQKKKNKLSDTEIEQLEKLEMWFWGEDTVKIVKRFDETYIDIKKWITLNKKIPSSTSKDIIEKKLGSWCCDQRHHYRTNKLSDDRIKKLNELPYWFWEKDETIN